MADPNATWPPSLKPVGKFMKRAQEVKATHPVVAHYCNLHSLKEALRVRDKSDENANRWVTGLLESCEASKSVVGEDDGTHQALVEEFALSIFYRADDEDRAGLATHETARTFFAAMCFIEVCKVFGPLANDMQEKRDYASWKAADINKALRQGRRPARGAPGEEEATAAAEAEAKASSADASYPDSQGVPPAPPLEEYSSVPMQPQPFDPSSLSEKFEELQTSKTISYPSVAPPYPSADAPSPLPEPKAPTNDPTLDLPTGNGFSSMYPSPESPRVTMPPPAPKPEAPVAPVAPLAPVAPILPARPVIPPHPVAPARQVMPALMPQPGQAAPAASTSTGSAYDPNYKPGIQKISDAQRLAKYAASALDFQDIKTAVGELEQALALLTGRK